MQIDRVEQRFSARTLLRVTLGSTAGLLLKGGFSEQASAQIVATPTTAASPTVHDIATARPNASVTPGSKPEVGATAVPSPTVKPRTPEPSPTVYVIPTARPDASVTPGPAVDVGASPVATPTITRHEQATSTPRPTTFEARVPPQQAIETARPVHTPTTPVVATPRPADTVVPVQTATEAPAEPAAPATPTEVPTTRTPGVTEISTVPTATPAPATRTPLAGTPEVGAYGTGRVGTTTAENPANTRGALVVGAIAAVASVGAVVAYRVASSSDEPLTRRSLFHSIRRQP